MAANPTCVDETFTGYMTYVGGLQTGQWVRAVILDIDCPEGVHEAEIVVDSVSPMSFVLN